MPLTDASLLVDAALAVTALVFCAAFGLLWRVNAKVGDMYVLLCHPDNGVLPVLKALTKEVQDIRERVRILERD